MTTRHLVACLLAAGLVAPLAVSAQAPQAERRDRPRPLRSVGDPGRVAAADLGLARQARDEGQWTAFRARAAAGALLHLDEGPVEGATYLANRADPAQPVEWAPDTVWSSCDGTLAVSEGRFRQPDGLVGSYLTVWKLQGDRSYKWLYDLGGPDVPQPAPRPTRQPAPRSDGTTIAEDGSELILVAEIPLVRGLVADCASRRNPAPPRPAATPASSTTRAGEGSSDDGTLTWRWEHRANGERLMVAAWLKDGAWQQVTQLRLAPTRAE